jgi:hypothetical protein
VAVQQFSGNGGKSHLWVFVPDNEGFNFIVNFHSGQVLDVSDNSLKNYATVRQLPFNGGESQRGSFSTRSLKLEVTSEKVRPSLICLSSNFIHASSDQRNINCDCETLASARRWSFQPLDEPSGSSSMFMSASVSFSMAANASSTASSVLSRRKGRADLSRRRLGGGGSSGVSRPAVGYFVEKR